MKRRPRRERFECPHCGADVAVGSAACRACGSDARTGWQDEAEIDYQSVDIPDGWSEDGPGGPLPERRPIWWVVVALLLALGLLALTLLRW